MATTNFAMPSTQRGLVEQAFLHRALGVVGQPHYNSPVVFFGQTTSASSVELFIAGKTGAITTGTGNPGASDLHRLYIPEDAAVLFRAYAMAYNITDNTLDFANSYVGGVQNVGGTVAAIVDYDTVAGGTQAFVLEADVVAKTASTCSITFAADNTNKALTVTVTGIAAKTHNWVVSVEPVCYISKLDNISRYGDVTGFRT